MIQNYTSDKNDKIILFFSTIINIYQRRPYFVQFDTGDNLAILLLFFSTIHNLFLKLVVCQILSNFVHISYFAILSLL